MGRWIRSPGHIYVLTVSGVVVPNATGSVTTSLVVPSKAAIVVEYAFTITTPGVGAANVTLNLRERGGSTDRCVALPLFSNVAAANTIVSPSGGDQMSGIVASGGNAVFQGTFPEAAEFDRIDLRCTLSAGTTSGPTGILTIKIQE